MLDLPCTALRAPTYRKSVLLIKSLSSWLCVVSLKAEGGPASPFNRWDGTWGEATLVLFVSWAPESSARGRAPVVQAINTVRLDVSPHPALCAFPPPLHAVSLEEWSPVDLAQTSRNHHAVYLAPHLSPITLGLRSRVPPLQSHVRCFTQNLERLSDIPGASAPTTALRGSLCLMHCLRNQSPAGH